jgi:AmmeMemoRadiSam system protein B
VSEIYKLREQIRIQPSEYNGQKIYILACDLGLSEPLGLTAQCLPLLAILERGCSHFELSETIKTRNLEMSIGQELLDLLESKGYLWSDTYRQAKSRLEEEFKNSDIRLSSHAGAVYPSEPEALKRFIDEILLLAPVSTKDKDLISLVAPHIDYQRGAKSYAYAYRHLAEFKPDVCILMGTSHKGGESLFQLSKKDFANPLATLQNDQDFTEEILAEYGHKRGLQDEFLHKAEHSLDLQLPFISYFCPNTKIVPILVNSFYRFMKDFSVLREHQEYKSFVSVLAKAINSRQQNGQKVLIIAAVDMAHLGKDFGDSFDIKEEITAECSLEDKEYLQALLSLSSQQMSDHIVKDYDQRRICGFSSLHTIIDVLSAIDDSYSVNIDSYEQAVNNEASCLVSFAAGTITREFKCLESKKNI